MSDVILHFYSFNNKIIIIIILYYYNKYYCDVLNEMKNKMELKIIITLANDNTSTGTCNS